MEVFIRVWPYIEPQTFWNHLNLFYIDDNLTSLSKIYRWPDFLLSIAPISYNV